MIAPDNNDSNVDIENNELSNNGNNVDIENSEISTVQIREVAR